MTNNFKCVSNILRMNLTRFYHIFPKQFQYAFTYSLILLSSPKTVFLVSINFNLLQRTLEIDTYHSVTQNLKKLSGLKMVNKQIVARVLACTFYFFQLSNWAVTWLYNNVHSKIAAISLVKSLIVNPKQCNYKSKHWNYM